MTNPKIISELCPCKSNVSYHECCGIYIETGIPAPSAEKLMRSRYTAYATGKIGYIKDTMKGNALAFFDEDSAFLWSERSTWKGLKVINVQDNIGVEGHSYVEFVACYVLNGKERQLHEISQFQIEDGVWYYLDGKPGKTRDYVYNNLKWESK